MIAQRIGPRMSAGLPTDRWKRRVGDYVFAAAELHDSMARNGYSEEWPVPVDPDGELLGGSHRVACAAALGITEVSVDLREDRVWAPAWDDTWFVENGYPRSGLLKIIRHFEQMRTDLGTAGSSKEEGQP